jgi:hypothetical protein
MRSVYCASDNKETLISQCISIVVSSGVRALGRSRGFVRSGSMWRESTENIYSKTLAQLIFEALHRLYSAVMVIGFMAVLSE